VREHRDLYARVVFHGLTVEAHDDDPDDDQRDGPVARRADT
jgi:hypothetical protein